MSADSRRAYSTSFTAAAAKSGTPQMTGFRPTIPALVPGAPAPQTGTTDVTAAVVDNPNAINTQPDARLTVCVD